MMCSEYNCIGIIKSNLHAAHTILGPSYLGQLTQLAYPCGKCGLLHSENGLPIINRYKAKIFVEIDNKDNKDGIVNLPQQSF